MKYLKPAHLMLSLSIIFVSTTASAIDASFRISNDTVGAGIETNFDSSDLNTGFEFFYRDKQEAINVSNINVHTMGQTVIGNLPTTVMLGFEATHMKEGEFKGSALALGGKLRVNVPSAPGLSFETRLHYAPDIVAYGDSDRFSRARVQASYRVIRSADISAGYQYLNTGIKDSDDRTFESGFYLGLKLVF